jgi:hypothetical protein
VQVVEAVHSMYSTLVVLQQSMPDLQSGINPGHDTKCYSMHFMCTNQSASSPLWASHTDTAPHLCLCVTTLTCIVASR